VKPILTAALFVLFLVIFPFIIPLLVGALLFMAGGRLFGDGVAGFLKFISDLFRRPPKPPMPRI